MCVLRPAEQIMTLSRLGSMHQTRLSFMRQLTRRMARENWRFSRPLFDIDEKGVGRAVYSVQTPKRSYSLVAFAHDLPAHMRTDRVIAQAWDATFTLFDGIPTTEDIERLAQAVPLQEAGRVSLRELSVSRANRSVRLWDYCLDQLAQGLQPRAQSLAEVGYLMRTTAVYGSAKLGAADRDMIKARPELKAPFQIEMLSVYLTRCFILDLLNHCAKAKGGAQAVALDHQLAQSLGVGNSTGLGMAPYIINHPQLFNNWILAKERAILRVRELKRASQDECSLFDKLLSACQQQVETWQSAHPVQIKKKEALLDDLAQIRAYCTAQQLNKDYPWDGLLVWSQKQLSEEGQELIASIILEPYGALVDELGADMSDDTDQAFQIDGAMKISAVKALLERCYAWAFDKDWQAKENIARLWYVSAEKLEPRLGERFDEPIADYEQPLAPARAASLAYKALLAWDEDEAIASFLLKNPQHRLAVKRAQISQKAPYGELKSNTISQELMPIDMLRAKLSFFGATHFDPRSDRWVRIAMYKNAPYPQQLNASNADFWVYQGLSA